MLKLLVFDNNAPLYLDFLREALQTEWDIKAGPDCTDWLKHEIGEADAAIGLQLHTQLLPYARRLKILLFPGAGTFHQDPNELPAGCLHANVYEHEIPIAEYVFFAMLALKTGLLDSAAAFRRGEWVGSGRLTGEPHAELYGGTLGLIGFGHIGVEVARRAPAFGLGVQAVRKHSEWTISDMQPVRFLSGPDGVDTLLKTSDVVVVACPLTHETRGMLNRRRLRLLKTDAVLINVARAEIIEEEALYDALRERWFACSSTGRLVSLSRKRKAITRRDRDFRFTLCQTFWRPRMHPPGRGRCCTVVHDRWRRIWTGLHAANPPACHPSRDVEESSPFAVIPLFRFDRMHVLSLCCETPCF